METNQNTKAPLRGRRLKPQVNLPASNRKRSALQASPQAAAKTDVVEESNQLDKHEKPIGEGEFVNKSLGEPRESESKTTPTKPALVSDADDSLLKNNLKTVSSKGDISPGKESQVTNSEKCSADTAKSTNLPENSEQCGDSETQSISSPAVQDESKTDDANKEVHSTENKDANGTRRRQANNNSRAALARRNFKTRFPKDTAPERSSMTMFDLIFYNPSNNPMKSTNAPNAPRSRRSRTSSTCSVSSQHEERLREEACDDELIGSAAAVCEDTAMPVPRVKVGPDGSLIIDEQSLVIETTGTKKSREELERSEVFVDTGVTYGLYKQTKRSKDWSDWETKKFYRALHVVGTDFSLMQSFFKNRNRRELKLKFKKEEKLNPALVAKALGNPLDFDINELEKELARAEEEEERRRKEELEKCSAPVPKSKSNNNNTRKKKKRSFSSAEMIELNTESETPKKKPATTKRAVKKEPVIDKTPSGTDYFNLAAGVESPKRSAVTVAGQKRRKLDDAKIFCDLSPIGDKRSLKKNPGSVVTPNTVNSDKCYTVNIVRNVNATASSQNSVIVTPKLSAKTLSTGTPRSILIHRANNGPGSATTSPIIEVITPQRVISSEGSASPEKNTLIPKPSPSQPGRFQPAILSSPHGKQISTIPASSRMEPGSLILLKTPYPQHPDRHILQVFMVTNNSSTSSPTVTNNSISTSLVSGISQLQPSTSQSLNVSTPSSVRVVVVPQETPEKVPAVSK